MKSLWLATVLAVGVAGAAGAAGGPLGLGVMVGEPTGLSAKYWVDTNRQYAADLGVAWSLSGDKEFHLHGDYLFHQYSFLQEAFRIQKGKLPLYFGVGGRVKFRQHRDNKIGIRIPVGASYIFQGAPVDLFAEIVPVVDLAPDTEMDLAGGVGIRFYF
jgi:hypothetical protein